MESEKERKSDELMERMIAADSLDYELLQVAEMARNWRRNFKDVVVAASNYAGAVAGLRCVLADELTVAAAPAKVMRLPAAAVPSREAAIDDVLEKREFLNSALAGLRKMPDFEDDPLRQEAEAELFSLLGIVEGGLEV